MASAVPSGDGFESNFRRLVLSLLAEQQGDDIDQMRQDLMGRSDHPWSGHNFPSVCSAMIDGKVSQRAKEFERHVLYRPLCALLVDCLTSVEGQPDLATATVAATIAVAVAARIMFYAARASVPIQVCP